MKYLMLANFLIFATLSELTLCPYVDCSASATREGWRWAIIQQEHPEYPVRPELNVIYRR